MTERNTARAGNGLSGRAAFVSGASSGFGAHFVTVLARRGVRVVAGARRLARVQRLARELCAEGGSVHAVQIDVTCEQSVARAVRDAASWLAGEGSGGGGSGEAAVAGLDVLVNNAGVSVEKRAEEHSAADYDRVMDTNCRGAWLLARAWLPHLKRAAAAGTGGGSVVNIASILGVRAQKGLTAYMASKAALLHLTRGLALEWAKHGVRVNAIAPGFFVTDLNRDLIYEAGGAGGDGRGEMSEGGGGRRLTALGQSLIANIAQRRFGELADLDAPLLLLADPSAGAFITGVTLPVDGGHVVSSL